VRRRGSKEGYGCGGKKKGKEAVQGKQAIRETHKKKGRAKGRAIVGGSTFIIERAKR